MSYQTAAELEKAYHELIIKSFGTETEQAWLFDSGASRHPEKLVEIERAHLRLKAAQMRERIQRRLAPDELESLVREVQGDMFLKQIDEAWSTPEEREVFAEAEKRAEGHRGGPFVLQKP